MDETSLLIIDPAEQQALNENLHRMAAEQAWDDALAGLNEQEKALLLRDSLRGLAAIKEAVGQAMMTTLWRVFKEGLWAQPLEGKPPAESFREWVEEEIEPYTGKDLSPSFLQDIVRVIERPFSYLLINPVFDPETNLRVTPETVMQGKALKKLKSTSYFFLDPVTRTADKNELILDIISLSSKAVKQKWIDSRQEAGLKLYYQKQQGEVPGTMTVVFRNLDPDQYELLFTLTKGVVDEEIP